MELSTLQEQFVEQSAAFVPAYDFERCLEAYRGLTPCEQSAQHGR